MNIDEGVAAVDEPFPGTPLVQVLEGFAFYADRPVTLDVVLIEVEGRPAREWAFLPAILLLLAVGALQRRRAVAAG